mgnify:CR=1 FL=1
MHGGGRREEAAVGSPVVVRADGRCGPVALLLALRGGDLVAQVLGLTGDLAKQARDGKLKPADMSGACFTISSLGGIGGTYFAPIVNAPEVAILGVSRTQTRPVWQDGAFVPRQMLPLSLSYDHRLIDGALGARFAVYLSKMLADPAALIAGGGIGSGLTALAAPAALAGTKFTCTPPWMIPVFTVAGPSSGCVCAASRRCSSSIARTTRARRSGRVDDLRGA